MDRSFLFGQENNATASFAEFLQQPVFVDPVSRLFCAADYCLNFIDRRSWGSFPGTPTRSLDLSKASTLRRRFSRLRAPIRFQKGSDLVFMRKLNRFHEDFQIALKNCWPSL